MISEKVSCDGLGGHDHSGSKGSPAPSESPWLARRLALLAALALCAALSLIYGKSLLQGSRASKVFRQYVADPIPSSVADIKVVQPKKRGGYGYVLRFGVNRADLRLILSSQPVPFKESQITNDLSTGSIYWRWKGPPVSFDMQGFTFLARGYEPSWYDLPSWENVETYALVQDDKDWDNPDKQILIYNPRLEQAYFIVFDYGGDAIWG